MIKNQKGDDSGRGASERDSKQVFEVIKADIRFFCSRVVPFAASEPLRELARNIDGFGADPLDAKSNRAKAQEVALFRASVLSYLDPLKADLKRQLSERYDGLLDTRTEELVLELVDREFREIRGQISDAAAYVAGLSDPWITELLV